MTDLEYFNKFQRFYFFIMMELYDDEYLLAQKCSEMETFMVSNSKILMSIENLKNNEEDLKTIQNFIDNQEVNDDTLIIYNILEKISEHICELRLELITLNSCLKYYTSHNNDVSVLNEQYNREIFQYAVMYDCYQRLFKNIVVVWNNLFSRFYNEFDDYLNS